MLPSGRFDGFSKEGKEEAMRARVNGFVNAVRISVMVVAAIGCGGDDGGGPACGPANCPGCCADGYCWAGTEPEFCGTGGVSCGACAPGQSCAAGACAGATTCGNGLVDAGEACDYGNPANG